MKRILSALLFIGFFPLVAWTQTITQAEYFIDQDPGFGQAEPIAISAGESIDTTFSINTDTLISGIHHIYSRVKNSNNLWSNYSKRMIYVGSKISTTKITAAEYFIDNDPGFGNANSIAVSSNDSIKLVFAANTGGLAAGVHHIYVRVKNSLGQWSVTSQRLFCVTPILAQQPIAEAEYFWNNDPGHGQGTPIPITPGAEINTAFSINTSGLNTGLHHLYVRVKNAMGWSVISRRLIYIFINSNSLPIEQAEYFIDNDPGLGKANTISITPGESIQNSFSINTDTLPVGLHKLYVRTKNKASKWSSYSRRMFYISPNQADDYIVAAEYFFNTDPGVGKGDSIAILPGNYIDGTYSAKTTGLPPGWNILTVRTQNSRGEWSVFSRDSIELTNCPVYENVAYHITKPLCENNNFILTDSTHLKAGIASNTLSREWDLNRDGTVDYTGESFTDALPTGTYPFRLKVFETTNPSCFDTIVGTIVINNIDTTYENKTICMGDSIFLESTYQTTSGTYYDTISNGSNGGCHSIHQTNLTVINNSALSVNLTSDTNSVCYGTTVNFLAKGNHPGSESYAWYVNNTWVGTGYWYDSLYNSNTLRNGDTVKVVLSSSFSCATNNPTSDYMVMQIGDSVTNAVTLTPSKNPICQEEQVDFVAESQTPNSNPTYSFFVNGTPKQSGSSPLFSSSQINNAEYVSVQLQMDTLCPFPTTSSAGITMGVYNNEMPQVQLYASKNNVCIGSEIVFSAAYQYGGDNPRFVFYANDQILQDSQYDTLATSTLQNTDSVWVVMYSDYVCLQQDSATSLPIKMILHDELETLVEIISRDTNVCTGDSSVFYAAHRNEGISPTFEWIVNGVTQKISSDSTFMYYPNHQDQVSVVLTSSNSCATNNPDTNTVSISVVNNPTPSITIFSDTAICKMAEATITTSYLNGGSTPSFRWIINGTTVQNGYSDSIVLSSLKNNDEVWCELTSSLGCVSINPTASNSLLFNVSDSASISIHTLKDTICDGEMATIIAAHENAGTAPTFEWFINGNSVQNGLSDTLQLDTLKNYDIVRCELTSDGVCFENGPILSNALDMNVLPNGHPQIDIYTGPKPACPNYSIVSIADAKFGGDSALYSWYVNHQFITTSISNRFISDTLKHGDIVQAILHSNYQCALLATDTSNIDSVQIASSLTASITIESNREEYCTGQTVTYTAYPANGGNYPFYQWYVNGLLTTSDSTGQFSGNGFQNGDKVHCVMTSDFDCVTEKTVSSETDTLNINSSGLVYASVQISSTKNKWCENESAYFNATATNGGNLPTYVWTINNQEKQRGTNTQFIASDFSNEDTIRCMMISNLECVANDSVYSNTDTLYVIPNSTPSIQISSSQTTSCGNTIVNFSAQVQNAGVNPTIQWYVNQHLTQSDTSTFFSAYLTNNSTIQARVFSNAECPTLTSDTSNSIFITVTPIPVLSASSNSPVKTGETIKLFASSNCSQFNWRGPSAFISNQQNPFRPAATMAYQGFYAVETSNDSGCTQTDSVWVEIIDGSCQPTYYTLDVSACVQLTLPSGKLVFQTGVYQDTIPNSLGCDSILTLNVQIFDNPVVSIDSILDVIFGNDLSLEVSPDSMANYLWEGPLNFLSSEQTAFLDSAIFDQAGYYKITITNINNCSATDSVKVIVKDPACQPIYHSYSTNACDSMILASGRWIYQTGTYQDTTYNSFGCDSIITYQVTVDQTPDISLHLQTPITVGQVLNIEVTPPDLTFLWEGPNNYTSTDSVVKVNNAQLKDAGYYIVKASNGNCFRYDSAYVTVRESGCQNSAYAYKAYSCHSFESPSGKVYFQSGYYRDTIVNAQGCDSILHIDLTIYNNPYIYLPYSGDPIYYGDTLALFSSNGDSYYWKGPNGFTSTDSSFFIPNASELNEGYYVLTLTKNGCSSSDSIYYRVEPKCKPIIEGLSSYCLGDGLYLRSSVYGGDTLNFSWSGPNGFSSNKHVIFIDSVSSTNSGIYTATYNNGICSQSSSYKVNVSTPPTFTLHSDTGVCEGDVVQFEAIVSDQSVGFWHTKGDGTFSNTNGNITQYTHGPNDALADSIYIYFTLPNNTNGCQARTDSLKLKVLPKISADIQADLEICAGDTLFLGTTLSGAYDITAWATNSGGSFANANASSTYYLMSAADEIAGSVDIDLTLNSSFGCAAVSASVNILIKPKPTSPFNLNKNTLCISDSLEVSYTGVMDTSITLNWLINGLPMPNLGQQPFYLHYQTAGTKTIELSATQLGCTSDFVLQTLVIDTFPEAGVLYLSDSVFCSGKTVTIYNDSSFYNQLDWYKTANGSTNWMGENIDSITDFITTDTVVYWVVAQNGACPFDTAQITVDPIHPPLLGGMGSSKTEICAGDTVLFVAYGVEADYIEWQISTDGGAFTTIAQTDSSFVDTVYTDSKYVVTVFNSCGAVSDTVEIKVLDPFNANYQNNICMADSAIVFNLSRNGDFKAEIELPDGQDSTVTMDISNNYIFKITNPGIYVIKELQDGCVQYVNDTITVFDVPNFVLDSIRNVSCFGGNDGAIYVHEENNVGTVHFEWYREGLAPIIGTNNNLLNLPADRYTLKVIQDSVLSCFSSNTYEVTQPESLEVAWFAVNQPDCKAGNNGFISIKATGGNLPYSFEWFQNGNPLAAGKTSTPAADSSIAFNLDSANYSVIITDAKGCNFQQTFTLIQPATFDVSLAITPPTCQGDRDAVISILPDGGQSPYTINWSDGFTSYYLTRDSLSAGTGVIEVTDKNGCTSVKSYTITDPSIININRETINHTCEGDSTGSISVSIYGGHGNYNTSWNNGETGLGLYNVKPGWYEITVIDAAGCSATLGDSIIGHKVPNIKTDFEIPGCGIDLLDLNVQVDVGDIHIGATEEEVEITKAGNNIFKLQIFNFQEYHITTTANHKGCIAKKLDSITFKVKPEALFELDLTTNLIGTNFQFTNKSENADFFHWTFGDSTNTSNDEYPGIISFNLGTGFNAQVCLDVLTLLGCQDTFCLDLDLFNNNQREILVPNSFTPNEDGLNDILIPVIVGMDPMDYQFQIRNIWGEKVFSTQDPQQGWDGKYKGKYLQSGKYLYVISLTDGYSGKKEYKTGSVNLIR